MEDSILIYTTFIRSILEQSCEVWNSMLSKQNVADIERVQKLALKLILKHNYKNYPNALNTTNLLKLSRRRQILCKKFAVKNTNREKMRKHFILNTNSYNIQTRNPEKYRVTFAHTQRKKKSPVIYMQNLLNTTWWVKPHTYIVNSEFSCCIAAFVSPYHCNKLSLSLSLYC